MLSLVGIEIEGGHSWGENRMAAMLHTGFVHRRSKPERIDRHARVIG
jgi:hypothetical protein